MRALGTKQVTVFPGETRPERPVAVFEGVVQARKVFFNDDTPVYTGDELETDDPRGGRRHLYVTYVKDNSAGGNLAEISHLSVEVSETPPEPPRPGVTRGHEIHVNGSNINIAFGGSTITQQVAVARGFEGLVDAVGKALAVIEQTPGIDQDEVEAARESAAAVIEESAKPTPNVSAIKKLLPTIRAVLTSAVAGGASAATAGLVQQLFVR